LKHFFVFNDCKDKRISHQRNTMKAEVLFITRNYPPKIGGLEVYSYNLIKEFEFHNITHKIVLTKSKVNLVWFLPYCLIRALFIVKAHPICLIHLCDGVLAPVGITLKILTKERISITIHGLDITYSNFLYQSIIPRCVARLDKVICVSRSTCDECIGRKVPYHKCVVIPNGIRSNEFYLPESRKDHRHRLGELLGVSLDDKKVLLTIGRLVERKGVAWFVETVMPRLPPSYYYLIAGDGPQCRHIREVSVKHNVQERVLLLGRVTDEEKKRLFNASDILLMPNIKVPHDVEGFGIVAIEAGSCGLPVIASNIQGIRDAVLDGKTGYLLNERDVDVFIARIKQMELDREQVRAVVNKIFDWAQIYKRYWETLMDICTGNE
jgi:glycosyltransferase involved in cell wall biosynthesis